MYKLNYNSFTTSWFLSSVKLTKNLYRSKEKQEKLVFVDNYLKQPPKKGLQPPVFRQKCSNYKRNKYFAFSDKKSIFARIILYQKTNN